MTSKHDETPGPELKATYVLSEVEKNLGYCLQALKSLGPRLEVELHHDDRLPDVQVLDKAAQAVNFANQIQQLLDPTELILSDHFLGYVRAKCLVAAVQQRLPDTLEKEGPMDLKALAEATGSRPNILGQILHILRAQGIFRYEDETGRYANSAASSLLRSDHWTQWHNWATMYGTQFYDIARGIPAVVRKEDDGDATTTQRSAAQVNYDTDEDMFSYFRTRGWVPELHRTLSGGAAAQMPGILADYPWVEVGEGLVMDIGGGQGQLLAALLREFPRMRGGLFDLPHIIEHARPFFRPGGQYEDVGERIADAEMVAGDFFQSVPPAAVYTMKWCLHDWKDAQAVEILKNISQSMVPGPNSRLVLLESILADSHSGRLSQYGNINMMMTVGGQERTEKQWHDLAARSGWRIERVYNLRRAWVKAMELRQI
ncbi:hypothetical protein PG993_004784 [Apiospora rasikravindrae]|uniref:O-methyltransferase n=1 Tax=Apiospora rasikravindrae TaxID=990691 RepID=A0ABR1TDR0_9PEZI